MKKAFHYIFDNWVAKLLSILLAFGLWAFVVNTGFRQAVLPEPIPVNVRDLASDLALASELPGVNVEVWAPTASFQRLEADELTASVNLAGLGVGEHTVEIKVFADDPNVRILEINPSLAQVTIEKRESQKFKVNVETEGQLGQGFVADKAEVDPAELEIRGAASLLKKIDQVVVRLPLNGETTDVEKTLSPLALDADRNELASLTFDPAEVQVKLPVIQAEDAKTVGVEVSTSGQPAEGFFVGNISVDPSTVTAQGSSKALDKISVLKTETIDLSGASAQIERTVKLELPDNIRAEPEQVKVTIEINAGTLTEQFPRPPEIINLGSGLASTVDPPDVTITLTGPADKIKPLRAEDIHLRVDVAGLGPGDHVVSLTAEMLSLAGEIQVSYSVASVTVHIETS